MIASRGLNGVLARPWVLVFLAIIAGAGLYLFFDYRTPPGVTAKGDSNETIAMVGLATSIVSMITAVIGLIQRLLEYRKGENG